jgi:trigger factor
LKKVFPDESVKTVEEFNNYAVAQVEEQWKRESDRKFSNDAITALIDNVSIELPDDFIRRYILRSNSEMTQEKLDAEYENYAKSFKWQLIENKLTQDSEIKVTMDEIKDYIRNFFIQNYFNQFNPVEIKDQLDKLVEQAVQKREDVKNIYDQLYDQKLVALLRDKMTTELKEGTLDEFIAFATGKPAETTEEKKTSKAKAPKAKKTVAEGEAPAPKKACAKKTTKKDKDE